MTALSNTWGSGMQTGISPGAVRAYVYVCMYVSIRMGNNSAWNGPQMAGLLQKKKMLHKVDNFSSGK